MKRIVSALLLILFASSPAVAGTYIESLTLEDINGPKISQSWRDGVYTGVFLTLMSSKAMVCPMMSTNMMKAAIEAAVAANEISTIWTVYHASLYVLARAGCKPVEKKEKPDA